MKKKGLQVIELSPDQYNNWDNFVEESPQGDVFCYSWWLDTITKSKFKIIAIFNCNEIQAGIPLAFDADGKINEPPLTRTLGPLYKKMENISGHRKIILHRKWLNLLLEKIELEDVVQFCTHQNFVDWLPFRWKGFKQMTRYTYIVHNKGKTEEDLWEGLIKNRKRDILKSRKNNLHVEISDDFNLFYKLEELTYERQGLKFNITFDNLKQLDQEITKRDKRRIFITYDDNNHPHAGVYVVFNHKSSYNLLSGSNPKTNQMGGHTLAMWEALNYFRTRTDYSNFGGSDIERIEKYLRGFGGKLTPYFHIYAEKSAIKKVPVQVNEVENNWKYHFDHFLHHSYCLFDITRKKIFRKRK